MSETAPSGGMESGPGTFGDLIRVESREPEPYDGKQLSRSVQGAPFS